jgi:hypothetical protein
MNSVASSRAVTNRQHEKNNINYCQIHEKNKQINILIANAQNELKILEYKLKVPLTPCVMKTMKEKQIYLRKRIKALLQQKVSVENVLSEQPVRGFPDPKYVPFLTQEQLFYQKKVHMRENPSFYMSDAEWDFGSKSRYIMINDLIIYILHNN